MVDVYRDGIIDYFGDINGHCSILRGNMSQLFELFENDATWAIIFAVFLYLSGAWLRPLVAKIPNTNWLFRVIRLVHLVLNKVDPGGNVAKDATKLTANDPNDLSDSNNPNNEVLGLSA